MWKGVLLLLTQLCCAKRIPDIYWNSSSPIFDISNTDHVNTVHLLDRVTIICPHPASPDHYEYSKLYVVSRNEYDVCELRNPRLLGSCATPDQQSSISVVFRDFSPIPGALEFQSGHSYYVIGRRFPLISFDVYLQRHPTAPAKASIARWGGLCSTKNMKLKFDVQEPDVSPKNTEPLTRARDLSLNGPFSETTPMPFKTSSISYVIHTVEPETIASMHTSSTTSLTSSPLAIVLLLLGITGLL
ncbi:unnamed protein product [Bursaphelenchus okinawaensis]|uniref:Ephrin RBD domain-containing protein n=1 Tax=Bursaphelenchus okinawaensis TaxID=465554 RepID=A0A811KTK9_9BILA|nr:unnamed protein product [Bursaphelenchus okinawaensis]CAG9111726.1 unnamed protein product [Bursaphelenchus okinawaensis]